MPDGTGTDVSRHNETPPRAIGPGGCFTRKCLAVSYFHMGKPHTIVGAGRFHYRVRDGIGWFPPAIATKQDRKIQRVALRFRICRTAQTKIAWVLYGQASRAISTG